jgi:hypothetical protein
MYTNKYNVYVHMQIDKHTQIDICKCIHPHKYMYIYIYIPGSFEVNVTRREWQSVCPH